MISISLLSQTLRRAARLRRLFDREARCPNAQTLRLMRLKSLQLRVQRRLAAIFVPPVERGQTAPAYAANRLRSRRAVQALAAR